LKEILSHRTGLQMRADEAAFYGIPCLQICCRLALISSRAL
jgi:hypothetical protein